MTPRAKIGMGQRGKEELSMTAAKQKTKVRRKRRNNIAI